jgi:hypothetical protein
VIFVVSEILNIFKQGDIASGGRLSQVAKEKRKRFWLDGSLGDEPRNVGITLADGLCGFGGVGEIISIEGLHDWERRAVPLLNYSLAFALQLRKSTENLSQCHRVFGDYSLRRHGFHFRDSLGWPAEHQSTSLTRG